MTSIEHHHNRGAGENFASVDDEPHDRLDSEEVHVPATIEEAKEQLQALYARLEQTRQENATLLDKLNEATNRASVAGDEVKRLRHENDDLTNRLIDTSEEAHHDIQALRHEALARREDATEQQRRNEELVKKEDTDVLTGCSSQNAWKSGVEEIAGEDENTQILLLDVNGLREANKARGQAKGDEIIARAGQVIRNSTELVLKQTGAADLVPNMLSVRQRRAGDNSDELDVSKLAYRTGGDEFAVLAPTSNLEQEETFRWGEDDKADEVTVPAGTSIVEAINLVAGKMYGVEPVAGYYTPPEDGAGRQGLMIQVSLSGSVGNTYTDANEKLQPRKTADKRRRQADFEKQSFEHWERDS